MAIDMRITGGSVCRFAWLVFQFTLTSGCSTRPQADYSQLGLVEIAGVVTLDGQPVPQAAVFFYQPNGSYSYGITDAAGHYVAMFNSEKSGVVPGLKQVEISTVHSPVPGGLAGAEGVTEDRDKADASAADEADAAEEEADAAEEEADAAEEEDPDRRGRRGRRPDRIPACYNAQGRLKVNIDRSDRSFDFELKSDCSTTSAS